MDDAAFAAESVEPGRGAGLIDVVRRRFLLSLLVKKEIRVRYRGSALGLLWTYVKPAVQFVVFFLAIGVFLGLNRTTPAFPVYLFAGMVMVNYFTEVFGNATRTVVQNSALVKKIYLPREMFPVASTWVGMIHLLPQVVVLIIGALLYGWRPTPIGVLAALTAFVLITVLALGLGLLFGALNVLFRDFENIVDLLLMVAVWTSPILYRWTDVQRVLGDGVWLNLYLTNPITVAVELFHLAFWFPVAEGIPTDPPVSMPPDLLWHTVIGGSIAVVLLVVGQVVFRRLEGRFAQEL